MADFRNRVPESDQGKFYVDDSCIYCDLCRETAPTVFREETEFGWASVFHQPTTPEELQLTLESVEGCPTDSIGSDGDQFDWQAIPSRRVLTSAASADITHPRKQWWRFW